MIFQRMFRIMTAKTHAKVDALEQPGEMLDQVLREKVQSFSQAKVAFKKSEKMGVVLSNKIAATQQSADHFQSIARKALEKDQETTARRALSQKNQVLQQLTQLQKQQEQCAALIEKQQRQLDAFQSELAAIREKRMLLKQRESFARYAMETGAHLGGEQAEGAGEVIERMEEKVMLMEAESEASCSTVGDGIGDPVQHPEHTQLMAFEQECVIDDEIAALKATINKV